MKTKLQNLSIPQQILLVSIGLSTVLLVFVLSFSANETIQRKNSLKTSLNKNRSFAVIEKIDRNFYERFGDVQAYAYNKLAVEAISTDSATTDVQDFINTMIRYYVLYDLMMIVNKKGEVIATNTTDKNDINLNSQSLLLGADFSNEPWFRTCVSARGPEGGAWYSDFSENKLVGQLYKSPGWGMAFAAPIKNAAQETIGVWYNFANWGDVTQGIRKETEDLLKEEEPDAFILMVDKQNKVIDASDPSLINALTIESSASENSFRSFKFHGKEIAPEDYIVSEAVGKGAYTYKGNNWKILTFVPKTSFSFSIFAKELSTFSIIILAILLVGIVSFLLLSKSISRQINGLQASITSVSAGELVEITKSQRTDEIGQMTNSVKTLIDGLRKTASFANEIGQGHLDTKFEPLSEKDVLGTSLVTMRDNLQNIRNREEKRQWATQGIAEFGDKVRKYSDAGLAKLCDEIIVFICKYVEANQATIFVKDERDGKPYLEMMACYAWERKKFVDKQVQFGEGLVGQVWREAEILYLTDVPSDYIRITSGLGDAKPSCVVIVPLKSNDEVLGIVEIASFRPFDEYVREFLQKIADNLASTLASAKTNDRTRALLEQTQLQTEALRAQEEEMRQNMEEMQATQEEYTRREREYVAQIQNMRAHQTSSNNNHHTKPPFAAKILFAIIAFICAFACNSVAQDQEHDSDSLKVNFSGYLDTYYFTNFNKPASRNNLGSSGISRGFDRNNDQFQLGMLMMRVSSSYKRSELVAEVGYGPNMEYGSYGSDFRYKWGTALANTTYSAIMIKQAYINLKAADKWTFTLGQFGTHIGYEYIDAPLNFHYSINNTFNAGIPFYHLGLKVQYSFSAQAALMGGIVNGTDNINDNNRGKSFIGQLYVAPFENLSLFFNTIQGNEANARVDGQDTTSYFGVLDFVATYKVNNRLTLSAWLIYGSQKGEFQGGTYFDKMKHWSGANFYITYALSDVCSLGARLEYFDNNQGARYLLTQGYGTDVRTLTLTGNFTLAGERLLLKPEFRVDAFKKLTGVGEENMQQFMDADGNFSKNSQSTLGMAAIYKF